MSSPNRARANSKPFSTPCFTDPATSIEQETRMHRFLTAAIAAMALVFGMAEARADAIAEILKNALLRIAVPHRVPPSGSMDRQRKPEGFDIDLAEKGA